MGKALRNVAAREWMETPRVMLDSPLGMLDLAVTQRDHISVSVNHVIILFGMELSSASFHVYVLPGVEGFVLKVDGKKVEATTDYEISQQVYASKRSFDQVSVAAKKRIAKTLVPLVNAWAKANPDVLLQAERAHLNNEIHRDQEKLIEALAEVAKLEDHIHELEDAEKRIPMNREQQTTKQQEGK